MSAMDDLHAAMEAVPEDFTVQVMIQRGVFGTNWGALYMTTSADGTQVQSMPVSAESDTLDGAVDELLAKVKEQGQ